MAPVDMSLMESGSDNQSEQQSSTRMSRVVAVLVVLGLVGSAFLLGRGSVTASVSQSVQLATPVCAAGAATANLQAQLDAAIALNPTGAWAICTLFKNTCTNAADQALLLQAPHCRLQPTCAAGAATANLEAQFKAAIAAQPNMVKHICDTFKAACTHATDAAWLLARPRCNGMTPCNGGATPVCEVSGASIATPDLGEQFSCATQGKPETQMATICATFKAHCLQASDAAWLNGRPRCNGKIPRHDGTLDNIN